MEMIGRLWQDPRIAFAVLGAASGVAGAFVYTGVSNPTEFAFPGFLWEVLVGLIFGIVMGGALVWRGQATVRKAIFFALMVTLSWLAALQLGAVAAMHFHLWPYGLGVTGLAGAGGIAGALAWLFPLFRDRRTWLTITGTGAAFGIFTGATYLTLLAVPSLFALFPPWQAAVALAIAWPLWRDAP